MEWNYKNIMEHFKQLIDAVDTYSFDYLTREEIIAKKKEIKEQLELDTAFKLLTKLEADIKTHYNKCIALKLKKGLEQKYNELCDEHVKRVRCYEKNNKREDCCKYVRIEDLFNIIYLLELLCLRK